MTQINGIRRAQSLEEMHDLMDGFISDESVAQGLTFLPRPSDVIISPYAKCGTTWMQQIVHGLRTGGDMDFEEVSSVVPWIETAMDLGIDLNAPQKAEPRAFKSHLDYLRIPRGCRYIVTLRNPCDAMLSLYRFFENWWFDAGTISVEDFALNRYLPSNGERADGGDYWAHFASWWEVRNQPEVLLLAYENIKQDLPGAVERIAAFLQIPLTPELKEIVVRQSSIDFMLAHKSQFEDIPVRLLSERQSGIPAGGDSAKVRAGKVGQYKAELSDQLIAEFDAA